MNGWTATEGKAPESVGWYIELTKWLIGISAAVLVFGFDKLQLAKLTLGLKTWFWVSAALLAISIAAGILCCMQFLGYANRKESGPAEGETEATVKRYRVRGTLFYQVCAGTLWSGIVIFGIVWATTVMSGAVAEGAAAAPVLVPLSDKAVMIKPPKSSDLPAVLTRDANGQYSWQPLAPPAGAAAPPPVSSPALNPPK